MSGAEEAYGRIACDDESWVRRLPAIPALLDRRRDSAPGSMGSKGCRISTRSICSTAAFLGAGFVALTPVLASAEAALKWRPPSTRGMKVVTGSTL